MGNFFNLWDVDADVTMDPRVGLKPCGRERVNMYKTGVPLQAYSKWASRLVEIGYTVGRVEQVNDGTSKNLQRQLVEVRNLTKVVSASSSSQSSHLSQSL